MESWRYLAIIGICLCVAAYMFASLFYPQLRWMFRLKRFAANIARIDDEQNDRFSHAFGLILAPIIGLSALAVAGWTVKEWKSDRESRARFAAERAKKKAATEDRLAAAFGDWEVTRVSLYDRRKRRDADEAGVGQAEQFVRSVAGKVRDSMVSESPQHLDQIKGLVAIELKENPADPAARVVTLLIDPKKNAIGTLDRNRQRADKLNLPPGSEVAARSLGELNFIDLDALEKRQRAEKAAEHRRKRERLEAIGRHRGATTAGPPASELRKRSLAIMGQPDEKAFVDETVGLKVEWEVRLAQISRGATIEGHGYQWIEKSKGGQYITLRVPESVFPADEDLKDGWWVRVRGTISSIKGGHIGVDAEELVPFVPDVR